MSNNKHNIEKLIKSNNDIVDHLIEQLVDCNPIFIDSKAIKLTKDQVDSNNASILSLID